jgi:hypothetical protein
LYTIFLKNCFLFSMSLFSKSASAFTPFVYKQQLHFEL